MTYNGHSFRGMAYSSHPRKNQYREGGGGLVEND